MYETTRDSILSERTKSRMRDAVAEMRKIMGTATVTHALDFARSMAMAEMDYGNFNMEASARYVSAFLSGAEDPNISAYALGAYPLCLQTAAVLGADRMGNGKISMKSLEIMKKGTNAYNDDVSKDLVVRMIGNTGLPLATKGLEKNLTFKM